MERTDNAKIAMAPYRTARGIAAMMRRILAEKGASPSVMTGMTRADGLKAIKEHLHGVSASIPKTPLYRRLEDSLPAPHRVLRAAGGAATRRPRARMLLRGDPNPGRGPFEGGFDPRYAHASAIPAVAGKFGNSWGPVGGLGRFHVYSPSPHGQRHFGIADIAGGRSGGGLPSRHLERVLAHQEGRRGILDRILPGLPGNPLWRKGKLVHLSNYETPVTPAGNRFLGTFLTRTQRGGGGLEVWRESALPAKSRGILREIGRNETPLVDTGRSRLHDSFLGRTVGLDGSSKTAVARWRTDFGIGALLRRSNLGSARHLAGEGTGMSRMAGLRNAAAEIGKERIPGVRMEQSLAEAMGAPHGKIRPASLSSFRYGGRRADVTVPRSRIVFRGDASLRDPFRGGYSGDWAHGTATPASALPYGELFKDSFGTRRFSRVHAFSAARGGRQRYFRDWELEKNPHVGKVIDFQSGGRRPTGLRRLLQRKWFDPDDGGWRGLSFRDATKRTPPVWSLNEIRDFVRSRGRVVPERARDIVDARSLTYETPVSPRSNRHLGTFLVGSHSSLVDGRLPVWNEAKLSPKARGILRESMRSIRVGSPGPG